VPFMDGLQLNMAFVGSMSRTTASRSAESSFLLLGLTAGYGYPLKVFEAFTNARQLISFRALDSGEVLIWNEVR